METTVEKTVEKKVKLVTTKLDADAGIITKTVKGFAPLTLRLDDCSAEVQRMAALFGLSQVRLADKTAVERTGPDGKLLPEAERLAIMHENLKRVMDYYAGGATVWELPRVGSGGRRAAAFDEAGVVAAMASVYKRTVEQVEAHIAATCEKKGVDRLTFLKTIAKTEAVAVELARRASAGTAGDVDDWLEGLDDVE